MTTKAAGKSGADEWTQFSSDPADHAKSSEGELVHVHGGRANRTAEVKPKWTMYRPIERRPR